MNYQKLKYSDYWSSSLLVIKVIMIIMHQYSAKCACIFQNSHLLVQYQPQFSLFYTIRNLFLAYATCPLNVDCNSALHHLHSGIQLMEHCCLKYFQSVEEKKKKRCNVKSHDACQDSCPYVIHITSAGKSKPVSSPGIIIMLIMMHPVSVGNSEVQQSVLKYIININLNSGLVVIELTRGLIDKMACCVDLANKE